MSDNYNTEIDKNNVEEVSLPNIHEDFGPQIKERLAVTGRSPSKNLALSQLRWMGISENTLIEIQTLGADKNDGAYHAFSMTLEGVTKLAGNLVTYDKFGRQVGIEYQGIYIVVNAHKEGFEARATHDEWVINSGITNNDAIRYRRAFYIDLDTKRVNDLPVSATGGELLVTLRRGHFVYSELVAAIRSILPETDDAESPLAFMMSGNGVQIWVRLANIQESEKTEPIVKSILHYASHLWSTAECKVDTSVGDAKRIAPLAGTLKRKGGDYRPKEVDKATWRPHRRVEWSSKTEIGHGLTEEHLVALAAHLRSMLSPEQLKAADEAISGEKPKNAPKTAAPAKRATTNSGPHPYEIAGNIPTIEVMEALGLLEGKNGRCPICKQTKGTKINEHVFYCYHETCNNCSLNNIGLVARWIFGKDYTKCDTEEGKANAKEAYLWLAEHFRHLPPLAEGRKARMEAKRVEVADKLSTDPLYLDAKIKAIDDKTSDDDIRALLEEIEVAPKAAGGIAKKKLKSRLALTEDDIELLLYSPEEREEKKAEADDLGASSYAVENGCICELTQTKAGAKSTPLCNFAARILACTVRDNGAEKVKTFEIEGTLSNGAKLPLAEVPASSFESMSWVIEEWNGRARIEPGRSMKDALRYAIQSLSSIAERVVYAHTGWREVDGRMVFLHGNGAIGSNDVQVQLGSERLAKYVFPANGTEEEVRDAVRRSLSLLDVAPTNVTAPLLASAYLAPLRSIIGFRAPVVLIGRSKSLKSTLAAQALAHFGKFRTDQDLPVDFRSTYASVESLLFATKDALSVVDDFYPRRSTKEAEAQKTLADQIVRAIGNGHGRDRMTKDLQERASRPPRGVVVITAEEDPYPPSEGESAASRALKLHLGRGDVKLDLLTEIQRKGNHALAMRSYIERIGRDYQAFEKRLKERHEVLVDELRARPELDTRQPEDLASLVIAAEEMLAHAVEIGAIAKFEADFRMLDIRKAILGVATEQTTITRESSPEARFLELVRSALTSGKGRIVLRERPLAPSPGCQEIGWYDDKEGRIYLHPTSAYALASAMAREANDGPLLRLPTIYGQLVQRGWAEPPSEKGKVGTKVSKLGGSRERVIEMRADHELLDGIPLPSRDAEYSVEEVNPPRSSNVIKLFPADEKNSRQAANDQLIDEV